MNPARIADRRPEDPDPVAPVHAVGIGPGDPAYLTRRARDRLEGADLVTGFETVIDRIRGLTAGDLLACGYDDQTAVLERFGERVAGGERGVAVLWGDPNVSGYQFLGRLEDAIDRPVRVVPGVSSVQVAASRSRTPLERSTVATLHRRGDVTPTLDRLGADAGRRHLLVLVRPYDWMPPAIAAALVDRGTDPALEALVLEELTLPEEAIERTTLGALAGGEESADRYSDRSILAVRADLGARSEA